MKITFLLFIAVTYTDPGNTTQQWAVPLTDITLAEEISVAKFTKDYERHPAFAVIRNCN